MSLKLTEITFEKTKDEINFYLQTVYNKASQLFSIASPFGQLLTIVEELHQLSILYLKNSINQFDLSNPNSNNYNIIRSAAIVAGHNPSRPVSASGTLKCQLKIGSSNRNISNGKIKISNKTLIKNKTNNLLYHIDLGGSDEQIFSVLNSGSFILNISQGEWKRSTFTGTGQLNQTFELDPESKEIENFKIEITVNGEYWEVKNHLYEMLPNEKAVVIKTNFNGGITVIFGNGNYGMNPPLNSIIEIDYVETDGSNGNIFRKTPNDWTFIDDVITSDGESINFENNFITTILTDINFGSNAESIKLMKNLLPVNMNNFILALPEHYNYAIKKLGIFSHVNAWNDNGVIKIIATPNINIFKNRDSDYFTVKKTAFYLDEYERKKLDEYLRIGGYIQLTQKYEISTPELSFYSMFVNIRIYEDAVQENVKSQITSIVSEYFLDLKRVDRVPKNDLISLISDMDEIDSVDIRFVSKKNEDYHRQFIQVNENSLSTSESTEVFIDKPNSLSEVKPTLKDQISFVKKTPIIKRKQLESLTFSKKVFTPIKDEIDDNITIPIISKPLNQYDENRVIGIDKILGDIVFESNEYPIIRGGWVDRNNIYYSESPLDNLSSININIEGMTPRSSVSKR